MRVVLVTGDRNWSLDNVAQSRVIEDAMEGLSEAEVPVRIVHGAARGVDSIADYHAQEYGLEIVRYPADWDKHGKAAGPIRNREMLTENPNMVWAFHDDLVNSKGTKDMVNAAIKAGIRVYHFRSDNSVKRLKEKVR